MAIPSEPPPFPREQKTVSPRVNCPRGFKLEHRVPSSRRLESQTSAVRSAWKDWAAGLLALDTLCDPEQILRPL